DDEEAVPRIGDLAAVRAEDLTRDREVELDEPVGEHDRDRVHGWKLAKAVSRTQVARGRVRVMDDYRIAIALWDGVEELDFAGPYEVLTAWSRMSERPISVRTASVAGEAVSCAHGLTVVPDTSLDELYEV